MFIAAAPPAANPGDWHPVNVGHLYSCVVVIVPLMMPNCFVQHFNNRSQAVGCTAGIADNDACRGRNRGHSTQRCHHHSSLGR